jgi:hypothetical protein
MTRAFLFMTVIGVSEPRLKSPMITAFVSSISLGWRNLSNQSFLGLARV